MRNYFLLVVFGTFLTLSNISQGCETLGDLAKKLAIRYGVPVNVVYAVIQQESKWKIRALSYKGARGLMQIMPKTAESFCGLNKKQLFNPRLNLRCGIRYLKKQIRSFGLEVGLCAYNGGSGNVQKYNGCPPFEETIRYKNTILANIKRGYTPASKHCVKTSSACLRISVGKYPKTSKELLSSWELKNLSFWDLKIMRNEIFARRGYIFTSYAMRNYFNQQSWYQNIRKVSSNPEIIYRKMCPIEKSNIKKIRSFELNKY